MPNFSILFPTHTNLLLHRLQWAHHQAWLWTSTLGPKCWQLVVWGEHHPIQITQVESLSLPDSNLSFYSWQWELHEERLRINMAALKKNLNLLILRSLLLTKFHVLWFLFAMIWSIWIYIDPLKLDLIFRNAWYIASGNFLCLWKSLCLLRYKKRKKSLFSYQTHSCKILMIGMKASKGKKKSNLFKRRQRITAGNEISTQDPTLPLWRK